MDDIDTVPAADSAGLYRMVRLIRRFEERAIDLVRRGVIVGGIHPYLGQEAVAAGACAACGTPANWRSLPSEWRTRSSVRPRGSAT